MRVRSALAAVFGPSGLEREELLLIAGLALITVALWPAFGRAALLAPGIVITWVALPSRVPFVSRPVELPPKRKGQES